MGGSARYREQVGAGVDFGESSTVGASVGAPARGVIRLWLLATAASWLVAITSITLAVTPGGFVPGWFAWVVTIVLISLCAAGISARSIRAVLATRWPEVTMFACVTGAIATAAFAWSLASVVLWFTLGSAAFVAAAFALVTIRRHPLRSLALAGGYVLVVLLFLSPVNSVAAAAGLRIKLEMVQAEYRSTGVALLGNADSFAEQDDARVGFASPPPGEAQVMLGAGGDPGLVVWTWTDGLFMQHPSAVVLDPSGHIGADGAFGAPPPDGSSLHDCESVARDWWWCTQYG